MCICGPPHSVQGICGYLHILQELDITKIVNFDFQRETKMRIIYFSFLLLGQKKSEQVNAYKEIRNEQAKSSILDVLHMTRFRESKLQNKLSEKNNS
jgi:hypothetical protein